MSMEATPATDCSISSQYTGEAGDAQLGLDLPTKEASLGTSDAMAETLFKTLLDFGNSMESAQDNRTLMDEETTSLGYKVLADSEGSRIKPELLHGLADAYRELFESTDNFEYLDMAISFGDRALSSTRDNDPEKRQRLVSLALSYEHLVSHRDRIDDITKAIGYYEQLNSLTVESHPDRLTLLSTLSRLYKSRFLHLSQPADINNAIINQERVIQLTPDDHPDRYRELNALGMLYQRRFECLGEPADLHTAIDCQEKCAELVPDSHPHKPPVLDNLGCAYLSLFERRGNPEHVKKAISHHEKAVELTPDTDPKRPARLSNLALSFHQLFTQFGQLEDREKAITCQTRALLLSPDNHPDRQLCLGNLGCFYLALYEHSSNPEYLNEAISYQEQALLLTPDGHRNKPMWLSNLGGAYRFLFERGGDPNFLSKATSFGQQAVDLTSDTHPDKPKWLTTLGGSYMAQFSHFGQLDNVHKAISCRKKAVILTPDDHPNKPSMLSNLGDSHKELFEQLGKIRDLEKAIDCREKAVLLSPSGHPRRALWLHSVATSHTTMFLHFGTLDSLDKAIKYQEQALSLGPPDHLDKAGQLSGLSALYQHLFRRLGKTEHIAKAIEYQRQALSIIPDGHPSKACQLGVLGDLESQRLGDISNFGEAIRLQEQAMQSIPDIHPHKAAELCNLGILYNKRFLCTNDPEDLYKAMSCLEKAVSITPDGDPHKSRYLNNLGASHYHRFRRSGNLEDMKSAVHYFKSAAILPAGDASDTFPAANMWALGSSYLNLSPLEAFGQCIELIHRRIWLGASLNQRYADLTSQVPNLVHQAVTAAIGLKRYDLALEWLEEGRTVVWHQMLQLRTPFDRISDVDEKLAQEFQQVSLELEQASLPQSARPSEEGRPLLDFPSERVARDQQRLALRWEELLGRARSLPGFEDFLKPKSSAELLVAAKSRTIVVINTGESQCDAIVLLPGCTSPVHIRLANLTHERVVNMRDQLQSSLSGVRLRYPLFDPENTQDHFREVLLILWVDVVEPILKELGYLKPRPPGEELPHIVWCTTGPLSFLPLHAAGNYDDPQSRVFNYAISSYSPTLGTLIAPDRDPSDFRGILAVGEAGNGGSSLPGTEVELDRIQEQAGALPFTRLDNNRASPDAVLDAMESHDWVHLACHASQNIAEPTASAFQLYGGELKLATITRRNFKHAEFAFLSACQTAMGDEKLPDEAIHLAAGMLMVGYSSVVATMWSINDQDAPLVAGRVYARMLEGGVPDSGKSARSLHDAVACLRNQIGEEKFARWVPFIHMGR